MICLSLFPRKISAETVVKRHIFVSLFFHIKRKKLSINMLRDWIKENTKSDGTTIVVNENISILPPRTFEGMTNLQEVVLPKKLRKIGILSFAWCKSLKKIVIPDEVVIIDDEAFRGCVNLEKDNIPSEVVGIGKMAFAFTSIREIVIPDSVRYIDKDAFYGCSMLDKKCLDIPDGCDFIKD